MPPSAMVNFPDNFTKTDITPDQIEQFHRDGYCVVDQLFHPSEIDEIEAFFEDYKSQKGELFDSQYEGFKNFQDIDPTKTQLRAMHPHRYSQRVTDWFFNSKVVSVLETLLGTPPLGAQTMYYYKPPGAKGQGMHQDNFYLLAAPATCIAAWTAIDTADLDNGCLYVAPGSHRKDIYCPSSNKVETWFEYGDSHINPFPRELKPIPVIVPRGSTMFFGGNLVHGSGPNRTKDRSRRTFIGHYISESSDQVARFYHPVLNPRREVVSRLQIPEGGGPCGDGWTGAVH
ncbi:MAG: phytanoyl-CoA dioxygenase family protein [Blastochloris sp.]|nr:phytanoyl-CoA dioxygenase family protein [Blastochloris sp.]